MVDKGFHSSLRCHVATCRSALELGWAMVICLLHKLFLVVDQNRSVSIPALRESPSFTQNRISSDLPGVWMLKLTFTRQSRYIGPMQPAAQLYSREEGRRRLRPPCLWEKAVNNLHNGEAERSLTASQADSGWQGGEGGCHPDTRFAAPRLAKTQCQGQSRSDHPLRSIIIE